MHTAVHQITRNTIIDFYRKKKLPTSEQQFETILPEEETNTLNKQLSKCLFRFMDELPEKYKEALMETEFGALSQKEYAAKLNISYSGAKSRVQRAKQHLKTLFVNCCDVETDKYGNLIDTNNPNCD